jgi:hypothetical protein
MSLSRLFSSEKKGSVNVSICFNCLLLFPSEKTKAKSKLFTFVLCMRACVCFSKRFVRVKQGERVKEMEFPVCLCFRIICRLYLSVDAVFFSFLFFMLPSVFPIYLLNDCVCVSVSAFLICRV